MERVRSDMIFFAFLFFATDLLIKSFIYYFYFIKGNNYKSHRNMAMVELYNYYTCLYKLLIYKAILYGYFSNKEVVRRHQMHPLMFNLAYPMGVGC